MGIIPHEGVGLDVQVPKHFVRAPMADEVDDVRVDLGQEEGCCASSAQAPSLDFRRKEAKVRSQCRD
jgi:hypothetical protein